MSTTYTDLTYTTFPDSPQTFVEMTDVNSSDGALLTQYQTAMQAGDFATARAALAQIPNVNNKIIDSVKMNTLFDTCIALERFYNSDIQPYVAQKQAQWEAIVNTFTDNFEYVGVYTQGTSYLQNNLVSTTDADTGYGNIYIAVQNNTAPLSDATSWRLLTVQGTQGPSGTGLTFMGAWDNTQTYGTNDVVAYDDSLWLSLQSNTNQTPMAGSAYWANYGAFQMSNIIVAEDEPASQATGDFWFQIMA